MHYEVGARIEKTDGRPLFYYVRACPAHPVTPVPHQTRVVDTLRGEQLEIEVCSDCGRIQKVSPC